MKNVTVRIIAWVLAAAMSAAPLVAQGLPAALIVRVQGDVRVERGGGVASPATVGERLLVGDRIVPASGARAVLVTRGGAQRVVTSATAVPEPTTGSSGDLFERAIATLARAASTDATTGGRQGMIRPIPGQTSLVAPRNGLNVATRRPSFSWTATPGQSYDLMLRKVDGGRPEVFEVGVDTVWTLPAGAPDLDGDAMYQWTVFVGGRRRGRALPAQEFRVIGLEESVELEDYLEQIQVFGLDPTGDGLFLTVVAYRDMELFYDARQALEAVEAESGLSWELYRLKGEVLAELGQEGDARVAFDRADELVGR